MFTIGDNTIHIEPVYTSYLHLITFFVNYFYHFDISWYIVFVFVPSLFVCNYFCHFDISWVTYSCLSSFVINIKNVFRFWMCGEICDITNYTIHTQSVCTSNALTRAYINLDSRAPIYIPSVLLFLFFKSLFLSLYIYNGLPTPVYHLSSWISKTSFFWKCEEIINHVIKFRSGMTII